MIKGKVQRVGFRAYVVQQAALLKLVGYVCNLEDGSLEVIAEGPQPGLEHLVASLRGGPPGAAVTSVDVSWGAPRNHYHRFEIRPG
jgi:acylphosphatase